MSSLLSDDINAFIARSLGASSFETFQLAGDASTRKYYRIVSGGESRVLMYWEPFTDVQNYPFLNVQRHFLRNDVRVPQVVAMAPELGVVLLEDLGDMTLERKFWENQNQEMSYPFYAQAIDELVKMHFACSKPVTPPSICQTTQFDTAKFMWEMNYAREHFLEKKGGVKLSDADQTALQKEFLIICETLDHQPKFVCHRDYHSRNLMLKLGKIQVIDFQDARTGPLQYDLVSLVHDSYVDLNSESIHWIKNDYLQKAAEVGPKGAIRPDFEDIFRVQTIQRCFKACGSFSSFFNTRGDQRYLKYIKPTATLVEKTLIEDSRFPVMTRAVSQALCAP